MAVPLAVVVVPVAAVVVVPVAVVPLEPVVVAVVVVALLTTCSPLRGVKFPGTVRPADAMAAVSCLE